MHVLEILRIVGWTAVVVLAVRYKKYSGIDVFWLRIIGAALMMMGSIKDLTNLVTIKSMWWFFGNIFIIISYIYMIMKDVDNCKNIEKFFKDENRNNKGVVEEDGS